jgi:hypothetical protein
MMRRGSADSNTVIDHLKVLEDSITALPSAYRRRLMVTCDGAGASHGLINRLDQLASRPGYQLTYSVGWELGSREREAVDLVPESAWQIAIDHRGQLRERRAEDACPDQWCAHARCWREQAHVTELTGLLREGPGGDQLAGWPASIRIFARRERPHPGAQLSLFEAEDGWRYSLWATNLPASLRGWRANPAYIDAVALNGDLACDEPKTLRYKILHAAARLVRGGRVRRLNISRTWPWAPAIATTWTRLSALPQTP